MPEGPEIRLAADRVASAVGGEVAQEVFFAFEDLAPYEDTLSGRRVTEVTTRGKAMLTRFEGDLAVYSHNQLYGRWYVMPAGRLPKTNRQLRFAIHGPRRSAFLYSASDIEVLDPEGEREHRFLSRLGPDILSQAPSVDALTDRLIDARFRRRQLGALLLDQGFVAGLGNYLRAEILFEAGLHPRRRAADCDLDQLRLLADRMIAITRRAYEGRGITLPEEVSAELEGAGLTRSQRRFWVFGRAGEPCRECGTAIEAATVGGRNGFWCPTCQRS